MLFNHDRIKEQTIGFWNCKWVIISVNSWWGGCFQAIILSTMLNGFKLLLKFLPESYSLSISYNKISLLPPKICLEAIYQTEADPYSTWMKILARGPTWILLWYYHVGIWQGYWILSVIYIIYQCKIIVINNYHG